MDNMCSEQSLSSFMSNLVELTAPDGNQAHSVFNHTLLSPRQVSLNMAIGSNNANPGLIGGRSSNYSRVIGTDMKLEDEITSPLPTVKASTSHYQDKEFETGFVETEMADSDRRITEGEGEGEEAASNLSDADTDDVDVSHFINAYLVKKQVNKQSPAPVDAHSKLNRKLESDILDEVDMFAFFKKETEILEQNNNDLQKQIDALREQTTFQTKVLKQLLLKKTRKRLKQKS